MPEPTPATASPAAAGHVSAASAGSGHDDPRRAVGLALALTILLAGMLSLFAWPSARLAPHELRIAVAGPAPAASAISSTLASSKPGAFAVTQVSTRDEAVRLITDHTAYGAIVVTATGPEILTASARSPIVAQLLGQAASQLTGASGTAPKVTDVVPLPADDPRGSGLVAGLLPIILGGLACAALSTFAIKRRVWRVATALLFAVFGGTAMTWLLQSWLGSLTGNFWANAGVLALATGATALAVLGLESLLGQAGLGVGALVMMLFGNALSGAASAPELLPTGWGAVGQWLPAGASNTALRAVAFFNGNGAAGPLLVLVGWAVLGLALVGLSIRRGGAGAHA